MVTSASGAAYLPEPSGRVASVGALVALSLLAHRVRTRDRGQLTLEG
jgi:hypothetical protein